MTGLDPISNLVEMIYIYIYIYLYIYIYIPRWQQGPPAALDFAVTSGSRPDSLTDAMQDCGRICARYEDFKCFLEDTKSACESQGFAFLLMIVEAVGGGWGKTARCVWSKLAKSSSLAMGELAAESTCAVDFLQRFSMILHRENARACFRRF